MQVRSCGPEFNNYGGFLKVAVFYMHRAAIRKMSAKADRRPARE